jgi:hypothetical protein
VNCLSVNLIQAYIDNEGTCEERAHVEKHLATCEACQTLKDQMNEANQYCAVHLEHYKEDVEIFQVPLAPVTSLKKNNQTLKGANHMKAYKKVLIAACTLGVLVTGMTIEPVRAAVGDVVSIFRANDIKTVDISLGDLKQIENAISSKKGEINIDNLAQIKQTGGEFKEISAEAAKTAVSFPIAPIEGLKDKTPTSVNMTTPLQVEFTLNIENVNGLMTTLGAKQLFDKELDGKKFSILMPATVTMDYKLDDKNGYVNYSQTKLPEIIAPEGTDMKELVSAISSLGILPAELQSKLKSMTDLDKTLYLPNVDGTMKPININGLDIYASFSTSNDYKNGTAMWLEDGILKIVSGSFDQSGLEALIKGAK